MNYYIAIFLASILTIICVCTASSFLHHRKEGEHKKSFWLKGIGSLSFVLVGLIMALQCDVISAWIIVIGLFFGLIGDQILALRTIYPGGKTACFLLGGLAFSVGHILYIVSLWQLGGGFHKVAIPIFMVLMICSVIFAMVMKTLTLKTLIPSGIYIGLVAVVSAMALSVTFETRGIDSILFAIGGFSFFLSDNFLGAYSFGKKKSAFLNVALHITYYAAQLCIAWSIIFI